jgi:hypothetical protein
METKLLLNNLARELSRQRPNRKLDVWISPSQEVRYVPAGDTVYLTFGIDDVPSAVRELRDIYHNQGFEKGVASDDATQQRLLADGYVKAEVSLRKGQRPGIRLEGKTELVPQLVRGLERVGSPYWLQAEHLRTDLIAAQAASFQKEAESLEASQRTLIASQPVESRYNEALVQYVRAKSGQIDRLEDKLETLIEAAEASLANGENAPGLLAGAASRGELETQRRRQMQRLEHLEERLEQVHEIREKSGLYATKVEELAEEKLRREEPQLARERDAFLEAKRLTKVNERAPGNEVQQQLSEELSRSLEV